MSLRRMLISVLGSLMVSGTALAQDDEVAGLVLRLPGGTRALGLGNAFVAGRGAEVLFYNPAQMFITRGTTVSVQRFGSVSTLGTLSTVGALGAVAIGAGVQHLAFRTPGVFVPHLSPGELGIDNSTEASSLAATLAAGIRWRNIRFGVGLKYIAEQVAGVRDATFAFDIGAARELGRTTLALAVQNIGPGLTIGGHDGRLPLRFTGGVASPPIRLGPYFDVIGTAALSVERDGLVIPGGGAELVFEPVAGWTFIARGGVLRRDERPMNSTWSGTAGAAFTLDRFSLDYAFVPVRFAGSAHRLGIRIQ